MIHAQGSLAVARLLKEIHPEVPIVFGGISSTYYAPELVTYPFGAAQSALIRRDSVFSRPARTLQAADTSR